MNYNAKLNRTSMGIEQRYKYWTEDGLEVRTCKLCKQSQAKSINDGFWVVYFTKERLDHEFEKMREGSDPADCEFCDKNRII